jgi:hypothetical protein
MCLYLISFSHKLYKVSGTRWNVQGPATLDAGHQLNIQGCEHISGSYEIFRAVVTNYTLRKNLPILPFGDQGLLHADSILQMQ